MIETKRLKLRAWKKSDQAPFAALTADKDVMRYFPSTLSADEAAASIARFSRSIEQNGWGFWAAELKPQRYSKNKSSEGEFIGFIGLNKPQHSLPFSPCVEIGWRLAKSYWGSGYASEGAAACLEFAFNTLELGEVVSMTPQSNENSEKVMQRIGMRNTGTLFHHPALPKGHALADHVLYTISRDQWILDSAAKNE